MLRAPGRARLCKEALMLSIHPNARTTPGTACRDDDYGRVVHLLMLTAQRREEVAALAWNELDLAGALWTIPKKRTKNGLPHDVPLSSPALSILEGAPKRDGRALVFGDGEGGFQGWSKAKAALDRRIAAAGAKVRPWRLHVFGAPRRHGWRRLCTRLD